MSLHQELGAQWPADHISKAKVFLNPVIQQIMHTLLTVVGSNTKYNTDLGDRIKASHSHHQNNYPAYTSVHHVLALNYRKLRALRGLGWSIIHYSNASAPVPVGLNLKFAKHVEDS